MLPPWPADYAWTFEAAQAACLKVPNMSAPHPLRSSDSPASSPVIPSQAGIQHSQETSGPHGGSSRASDFQTQWLAAEQELREERFDRAAAAYDLVLRNRPQCAPAVWNRALAQAYGRSAGAVAGLAAALSAAPSPAAGQTLAAVTRVLVGDIPGAQSELAALSGQAQSKAAPRSSFSPGREGLRAAAPDTENVKARDVLWAQAMVAWGAGKPHEARLSLARLAKLEPESAAVWFELGGVALEEARTCSRRLAEVAPNSDWNRRLQAEAVQLRYPGLARNLRGSGSGAGKESAPAENSDQFSNASSESPHELYLRTHSALLASEEAYARAAVSPRFQAYFHAMRALAAEQEDDESAALREYSAGLQEDPQSALLHAGLGHVYRRRMDLPPAERELREAWKLDPSDALVAFELGDTEARLGKTQPALELLNQALELDAGLLIARWSRAKIYIASGDSERALADLEAAVPADSSGDLQWQLARLYRKLGRADLAAQAEKRSEDQRAAASRNLVTKSSDRKDN